MYSMSCMHTVKPDKSYFLNCQPNFRQLLEMSEKTEHTLFYLKYYWKKYMFNWTQ